MNITKCNLIPLYPLAGSQHDQLRATRERKNGPRVMHATFLSLEGGNHLLIQLEDIYGQHTKK